MSQPTQGTLPSSSQHEGSQRPVKRLVDADMQVVAISKRKPNDVYMTIELGFG